MNFVSICAQTIEAPRIVYISETQTVTRCNVLIPPVGNKAPTACEYNVYGKQQEQFRSIVDAPNQLIFIHGAKLRHDLEARTHSLHGGITTVVNEDFPIFNTVILGGRCIKDIDPNDSRQYKTTPEGLMIANQTISVNTGRAQADLFNFYAINKQEDRLRNAELICNFTRKGVGLTINGRLTTDSWKDGNGQQRTNTKIQLVSMTLGPKPDSIGASPSMTPPVQLQQPPINNPQTPAPSLWGGKTVDNSGLPDLPTSFGSPVAVPNDDPF
jgi:single-stranded DNA-binding protein